MATITQAEYDEILRGPATAPTSLPTVPIPSMGTITKEEYDQIANGPAPEPERKPWGLMDDLKVATKAVPESLANAIPFLGANIVTDTEMAPAPSGMAVAGNMAADMAAGLSEGALSFGAGMLASPVGGIVGLGAGGASGQLMRNAQVHRIEDMREKEAAVAAGTLPATELNYDVPGAIEGYKQLDTGDVADAGVAGVLNMFGGKIGQMLMKGPADEIAKRLVASGSVDDAWKVGKDVLLKAGAKIVGADAAAGVGQGVSMLLNRENN